MAEEKHNTKKGERKLIEGNFPCEQVGAETRRERDTGQAPPTHRLHVWWARRPLTPSRAALLGSILPADVNPDEFIKGLGIVKKQAVIGDKRWNLVGKNLDLISDDGKYIFASDKVDRALSKEIERRNSVYLSLQKLCELEPALCDNYVIKSWLHDNEPFDVNLLLNVTEFLVEEVVADPALINQRIELKDSDVVKKYLGNDFSITPEDMYGYGRAYQKEILPLSHSIVMLDCTAGGGSIPFEALRLGCNVIANDINPVASAIEKATLDYPVVYGSDLLHELDKYSTILIEKINVELSEIFFQYDEEKIIDYLYHRTVTCPHCGERAPLLNAFALQKKADGWMVIPEISGNPGNKKVRFVPTRLVKGKGPKGENPDDGTVKKGTGTCIFCGQAIDSEEIKRQARGESDFGTWSDDLYCVVAKRVQPKLDKEGNIQYIKSGADKGKVKTETVTFFREPVAEDFAALERAKEALEENWQRWDDMGLIPTDIIPVGHKTAEPLRVGVERWCDMFTPRQLLCHLTAMETLQEMSVKIKDELGEAKGTAVIHYLQYMLDKGIDYNSRQTRWEYTRSVIKGTFGRHDFSLKWTFGEMIYTGQNSGLAWGKSQVMDAYKGICDLLGENASQNVTVLNGSAANLAVDDSSVDVICLDPPYYNNVQYAELSDYFYVWQKRTFRDLYPDWFSRRLTNKVDEAVANPVRDGSAKEADRVYESRMSEIFAECRRVLKDEGIMVLMFTHKTQEAWQTLTRALIENGWLITSAFPVDSESGASLHQKDMAAAASSIFIACRKRDMAEREPAIWRGLGGSGVLAQLKEAVRRSLAQYEVLKLNAVDEMVASYGSALKVLSENWPVMDGDELVSPMQAMREASTVVAQYQMTKLTEGRLSIDDVAPEAGIALTVFGIYGMGYFPYDDALSLSRSLNISLANKAAGYAAEGRMIGINDEISGRQRQDDDFEGYFAPLVRKGSKLRLVRPEERIKKRLENPQSEWDMVQGLLMAYRAGDVPVAKAYLDKHGEGRKEKLVGVLKVWADGCGSNELQKEARQLLFGLK